MNLQFVTNIVGHTRSKATIQSASFENLSKLMEEYYKSLPSVDLFDAYAAFDYLTVRSIRRVGKIHEQTLTFEAHLTRITGLVTDIPSLFEKERQHAEIHSAFDLREHGKSLVSPEFRDL